MQIKKKKKIKGISLVVQWLRLLAVNVGDPDSILGQGTRSHMKQLRVRRPQLKTLSVATKTSQGKKKKRLESFSHTQLQRRLGNIT